MPETKSGVCRWIKRGAVPTRRRRGRGGGVEIRISSLPAETQAAIARKAAIELAREARAAAPAAAIGAPANDDGERSRALWAAYMRSTEGMKDRAKHRLGVVQAVEALLAGGLRKLESIRLAAAESGDSPATVRRWVNRVRDVPLVDRLPALMPETVGRLTTAECDPEAWHWFKDLYLRPARPTAASCYELMARKAAAEGWTYPSLRTLMRRIEREIEPARVALARHGEAALKRKYPAQERDRSIFHAMEAINADGHKFDVFVRWEDGTIGRPIMVAVQDLYSGKLLGYRVGPVESADQVRLALLDTVSTYGLMDHAVFDNGRGFASKWITGGVPNRFRFSVKSDEPDGVLKQLGVQVHWTLPYSGQSKPIERAFRDLCNDVAKHPAFEGAWTGNKPDAKPEDYGSAAVPIDRFCEVLAEQIVLHNARPGRRSAVCAGRSLDEAFNESYARSFVRKATAEQIQTLFLAGQRVTADRETGAVRLFGNRYWTDSVALARAAGRKIVARFDPDHLDRPIHLFTLRTQFIATAELQEKEGFLSVADFNAHERDRRAWMKNRKEMARRERRMSAREMAAALPSPEMPQPPETPLVRPMFGVGGTALAARAEPETREFTQEEWDELSSAGIRRLKLQAQGL